MADHIRRCARCLVGLPCTALDELISHMSSGEVIEAATEVIERRRTEQTAKKRYQREYMRKWRKKQ